jgi:hypothetical protein
MSSTFPVNTAAARPAAWHGGSAPMHEQAQIREMGVASNATSTSVRMCVLDADSWEVGFI